MLAYSPLFGAPSGGSDWCGVFDDDPTIYYNGLQDQDLSYDHYSQQAISPPNLEYPTYSFDDQLIPLPCSPNVAFGASMPLPMLTSTTPPMAVVSSEWHNGKLTTTTMMAAKEEVEILVGEKKKKEHHNASERNRRKRINELYASLRHLLPAADHMKKLSIPSTVGRALKYIPQLQIEVQDLLLRKEQLLPCINKTPLSSPLLSSSSSSSSCTSVEATQLGNGEISIQISALKSLQGTVSVPISEVLRALEEEDGVVVVDVSSSESSVGRVFYRIHLMVEATHNIECELLREKVMSWCQKSENLYSCLWMN